jgi:hypothetical protein
MGTVTELLNNDDLLELEELKEYANRFHHDTNAAAASHPINDAELVAFGKRVLDFSRRPR